MSIEKLLIDSRIITEKELKKLLNDCSAKDEWIGTSLDKGGFCSEQNLAKLLAESQKLSFLDLSLFFPEKDVINLLGTEYCLKHFVIPISNKLGKLVLGIVNPLNKELIVNCKKVLNTDFKMVVITRLELENKIKQIFEFKGNIPNIFNLSDEGFDLYNLWLDKYYENGFLNENEIIEVKQIVKNYGNANLSSEETIDSLKKKVPTSKTRLIMEQDERQAEDVRLRELLKSETTEEVFKILGREYFETRYSYLSEKDVKEYLADLKKRLINLEEKKNLLSQQSILIFAALVIFISLIIYWLLGAYS